MAESQTNEYDYDEAVRFIQNRLPQEVKGKYSDDDIELVIDTMVDYFERNGWSSADEDEVFDIDVEDLVDFVSNAGKKNALSTYDPNPEYLRWVIEAELDYEESLD
jgi:hypothetical protein